MMEQHPQKGTPMDPDAFEGAFSTFWDGHECSDLNWVIYDLVKAAFAAGCRAAGSEPPEYPRFVTLHWEISKTPGPRS